MPDKSTDFWLALAYAIVGISGASGGCLVVAQRAVRGKTVTAVLLLAYAFIGGVFGVAGASVLSLFSEMGNSLERLMLMGLVMGVAGSVALASANLSIRLILRRLGIEVDMTIKKIGDD